jgi:hypothetical protein
MPGGQDMSVEMQVDGKTVPLNEFVQEIIGNVAEGIAQSLRGIDPGWNEIVIKVKKD